MGYINSSDIKVFPSAYRNTTTTEGNTLYDPESKLFNEKNITNISNKMLDRDSFIQSYDSTTHRFIVCIHGYWFDFIFNPMSSSEYISYGNIFASIKVKKLQNDTDNTKVESWTLIPWDQNDTSIVLDTNNQFKGLYISGQYQTTTDTDIVIYNLVLFEHKKDETTFTVNQEGFSTTDIKRLTVDTELFTDYFWATAGGGATLESVESINSTGEGSEIGTQDVPFDNIYANHVFTDYIYALSDGDGQIGTEDTYFSLAYISTINSGAILPENTTSTIGSETDVWSSIYVDKYYLGTNRDPLIEGLTTSGGYKVFISTPEGSGWPLALNSDAGGGMDITDHVDVTSSEQDVHPLTVNGSKVITAADFTINNNSLIINLD